MIRALAILLVTICAFPSSVQGGQTLRTASEVTQIVRSSPTEWARHRDQAFELVGSVSTTATDILLSDGSGHALLLAKDVKDRLSGLASGDIVRASGKIRLHRSGRLLPQCDSVTLVRHGPPPAVRDITGNDFVSGRYDYQSVRLRGCVLDVVVDEIDPVYTFVILDCDGERIPFPSRDEGSPKLIGSRVEVTGFCIPAPTTSRQMIGRILQSTGLRRLDTPASGPFDVPSLSECRFQQPRSTVALGRRKLRGRVLASWDHSALIKTEGNLIARLDLIGDAKPACDDTIEASGLPETDAYTLLLRRASWRKAPSARPAPAEPPVEVAFSSIFVDKDGRRRFDSLLHGKPIRTRAMIRNLPSAAGPVNYMLVGTDEWSLPVDISSATPRPKGLSLGSTVEITGIYLLECQPWRPNAPIPPIDGIKVIVRSPADIRIIAAPPWWTADRLLVVIGVLGAVLSLVIFWNFSLRRLAERRGRELSEESVARAEAEIKTAERTRLAVELHDTIAQNLTGVSIALDTARQFCETVRPEIAQQIDVADATLDSCQTELRNCLWDLRNQALEESDLNTAIRTALLPHAADAALDIRFNVNRDRLTENTAHTILRIIRELVINAIRHGHATRIQIAGALDPDALRFSVRDNGSGFDADDCPGVAQKHFGLQGVRERLSLLGGELSIESARGAGTRIVVSIPLPDYNREQAS